MKKFIILACFTLLCAAAISDTVKQKAEAYIARFGDIAVDEMYRSGIPASITLAQGMLESGYGDSHLTRQANNHFGIKCHSDWKGERVYYDDDRKGECFRKYPHAEDSFRDHSDFLRYKSRYSFLFDFEITDYRSWAYGLKKAGYATDPSYPSKLIEIIEKYGLTRFDSGTFTADSTSNASDAAVKHLPASPSELEHPIRFRGEGRKGTFPVFLGREVLQFNGIPFIYARDGETYRSIAKLYRFFPGELASFNDDNDPDRCLDGGQVVYLHRKALQAAKGQEKHICSFGETLRGISQRYGIRLKSLMKLNGITDADIILSEDQTLALRKSKK